MGVLNMFSTLWRRIKKTALIVIIAWIAISLCIAIINVLPPIHLTIRTIFIVLIALFPLWLSWQFSSLEGKIDDLSSKIDDLKPRR